MTEQPVSPPPLPAVNEPSGEWQPLAPNARWLYRASQLGLVIVPWIGLCILTRVLPLPIGPWTGRALLLGLLVALLIWAWGFAERRFAATRFRLDAEGFSIKRGVIWQSETFIARSRVQHTDIQQGPIDRHLGLAELLVHTAGTEMAGVHLNGLDAERARSLRDALLEGHDQRF